MSLFGEPAQVPRQRTDFLVPTSSDRARCSSCGAPIAWIETGRRRADGTPVRMPLDLDSAQRDPVTGATRAESHFAHCFAARRRRGASADPRS